VRVGPPGLPTCLQGLHIEAFISSFRLFTTRLTDARPSSRRFLPRRPIGFRSLDGGGGTGLVADLETRVLPVTGRDALMLAARVIAGVFKLLDLGPRLVLPLATTAPSPSPPSPASNALVRSHTHTHTRNTHLEGQEGRLSVPAAQGTSFYAHRLLSQRVHNCTQSQCA
jgi:hypothetical protein